MLFPLQRMAFEAAVRGTDRNGMNLQTWIRAGGYLGGAGGLACTLLGRQAQGGFRPVLLMAGAVLLGLMFLCFLLSYAMMVLRALSRPRRPPGFGPRGDRKPGLPGGENGG
jgi:hypothetical protein